MDSANAKLIEEWVEKEIMPNELLLILEAVLMPMLVTSILAELMVNKGNKYKRAYSGHQSREVINAQAEQKWNVVDKEITMAWEEYMRSDEIKEKAEKMRQETSKTWRRKGQPVVRTPSALKNKPMLLLLQRQRRVRLAKITPDVQKGAKAHHKKRIREGTDDATFLQQKSEARHKKAQDGQANLQRIVTEESVVRGAAACAPALTDAMKAGSGTADTYLDLTKNTKADGFGAPYEKRIVAAELDARPKDNGQPWYSRRGNGDIKESMAELIVKLRVANGNNDRVLRKGDPTKDAKAKRWKRS